MLSYRVLLITLIVAMAISFTVTKAQPVNHWFKTIGGGDDEGLGIAINGYIYITGGDV